jgi:Icc-related predicted phosphoesterase
MRSGIRASLVACLLGYRAVILRVAVVADLHGHLPEVPACDVLVIAGDIAPVSDHRTAFQARWLAERFAPWLEAVPAARVVGTAGNHDFVFEQAPESVPDDLRWTYLQDCGTTIDGVRFWGSPWTPWFHDWAFNAPRGDDDETFLEGLYDTVPGATDVLVVHGPPAGFGDLTARGARVGSHAFLRLIDRTAPQLAVFGHIHEDRGEWTRGASVLANVAAVDLDYRPRRDPVTLFEVG